MKYLFNRIFNMNYKKLFETVNKAHELSHKSKIRLFFDIIMCGFKYKAGYMDYISFGFYNLKGKERKTYLTRGKNNLYVRELNNKEYWHLFDNKNEFNEKFSKYLKRDWMYINDNFKDFEKFIKGKDSIIVKPNNDSGGTGVEKVVIKDYKNAKELYDHLVEKKQLLLEEVVKQHKDLNKLHPTSVNTLRIITVKANGKVNYLTSFLRIGNGGVVDNTCSGGMLTMVDLESGKTLYPACDVALNTFEKHPMTNVEIAGFQIPYWKECLKLTKELAESVDEINYIAWDIAVTDDGPVVIEGNPYPGYYYQFPVHCPDKCGILPRFKDILKK